MSHVFALEYKSGTAPCNKLLTQKTDENRQIDPEVKFKC